MDLTLLLIILVLVVVLVLSCQTKAAAPKTNVSSPVVSAPSVDGSQGIIFN